MTLYTKPTRYGWHWHEGQLSHQDGRTPEVGVRLVAKTRAGHTIKRPVRCGPGLHAHGSIAWAGGRNFGSYLAFVLVDGVLPHPRSSKFVGIGRTVLWQKKVPPGIPGTERALLAWAHRAGFRRASATAKARRLRK